MENGKRAACSNRVTVSDEEIKEIICEQLGLEAFDEAVVGDAVEAIKIGNEGISIQVKNSMAFGTPAMPRKFSFAHRAQKPNNQGCEQDQSSNQA